MTAHKDLDSSQVPQALAIAARENVRVVGLITEQRPDVDLGVLEQMIEKAAASTKKTSS